MAEFEDFVEAITDEDENHIFETESAKRARILQSPAWRRKFVKAAGLIESVRAGKRPGWVIREAFATADFPILTTNILQWKLIQEYMAWPQVYATHASIGSVPDFRQVKASNLDGLDTPLSAVPEGGEYPELSLAERDYVYSVSKFGREFGITWEAMTNDFLRVFDRMPNRLSQAAVNTVEQFATALYSTATGPSSAFFTAGNKNVATGALTPANLAKGIMTMIKQQSASGNPIMNRPAVLEVPAALEYTAEQVVAPGVLIATGMPTTSAAQAPAINLLSKYGLKVVVNPWLNKTDVSANVDTSWYLWSDPRYGSAMEVGFLQGHENPELRQKMSNSMLIGGGMVPSDEGDFDSDKLRFRVRHIVGGTLTDFRFAYASNGTTA